jgi:hypothetical protein
VTRWLIGLAGAGALAVAALAAQGQRGGPGTPPGTLLPAAKGTALILGQVVDGSSGQPVAEATVTLTAPGRPGGAGNRGGVGAQAMTAFAGAEGIAIGSTAVGIPGAPGGTRLLTDDQGRFVFHDLPAGSYSLAVGAPGYVPGAFGQARPNGPSHTLDLTDGERTSDAKIRVWKYAVLSGTVVDEVGEPAVGITVRALRRAMTGGVVQLTPTGTALTDDRGEFRLATLVPGDYVVAIPETQVTMPVAIVQTMMDSVLAGRGGAMLDFVASGGPMPSPGGRRVGDNLLQSGGDPRATATPSADGKIGAYLTQYYPAATSPTQAVTLTLRSGEEKGGLNLQLRVAPTATVTGSVVGPDGPVSGAPVKLTATAVDEALASGFETASTLTRADGTFTLLAVPAGQYVARVSKLPRPTLPTGPGAAAMSSMLGGMSFADGQNQPTVPLYGQAAVTVSGGDVAALAIQLREGAKLTGRVEFVGSSTPPRPQQLQSMTVTLTSVDGRTVGPGRGMMGPTPPPGGLDANGQFKTVGYPPGRYTVTVTGPVPPAWTLKAVVVAGKDVLTAPLDLTLADVEGAVLTYTDKVSQLSGVVHGLAATTSATIFVFPADYKSWIADGMSARRLRQTAPTAAGAYSTANLLPGDYLVAAVDANDIGDTPDGATFEALARVGSRVSIADGDKKTLDLTLARIR